MLGLKKKFELRNGVAGDYWAPVHCHVDCDDNKIEVKFELFYNKKAYKEGKLSLGVVHNVTVDLPVEICQAIDALLPEIKAKREIGQDIDGAGEGIPGFFATAVPDALVVSEQGKLRKKVEPTIKQ